MSIAAHLPRPGPISGSRLGGGSSIGSSRPPTDLLPERGTLAPAPAPAPERVLAQDALRLIRLARTIGPASAWLAGDLSDEIEMVRRQLDPIRSRRALSASYRREASNRYQTPQENGRGSGVVRMAYTLRWLELGPDRP